jgi:hypothetical protein
LILEPPDKVQKLQAALQAKAKGSPGYRFYLLYDKVYRKDVLEYAYRCCKANRGAPGVDSQDFADIEQYGEERWLGELADKLHRKTYRAEAVRRVWIPKSDGRKRPLGIPCIADRTVMTAAVVVLTPIFEVDMPVEQHAYRANFSAHTAVRSVHSLINTGHTKIIEGDLAGYFDSLPHAELLKSVARRVSDRHLLHLIKMWLDAPVEEDDGYVICCKGDVDEALAEMRWMMERLKLTVNEAKTRVCRIPHERFDFLGYEFGRCYSKETGRAYLGTRPSKKSLKRIIEAVHECTDRRTTWRDAEELVTQINGKLVGWSNYFSLGPVSKAYRAIEQYTKHRLRRWLCDKHKVASSGWTRYPDEYLHEKLGLVRLCKRTQNLPWAKA